MVFSRLLSDLLFLVLANAIAFLALRDVSLFLYDPRIMLLIGVLNVLWVVPVIGDLYVSENKILVSTKDYCYFLTMGVLLLEFVGSIFEYSQLKAGNNITQPFSIVGLGAIGAGFLVSSLGWLSIRRYSAPRFQIIEGHKVVNHGLYRFIRHPICAGFFLIALGAPIYLRSVIGLCTLVFIVTPVWIYVIKEEERFLSSNLGEDYGNYLRDTKRFIPFIY